MLVLTNYQNCDDEQHCKYAYIVVISFCHFDKPLHFVVASA